MVQACSGMPFVRHKSQETHTVPSASKSSFPGYYLLIFPVGFVSAQTTSSFVSSLHGFCFPLSCLFGWAYIMFLLGDVHNRLFSCTALKLTDFDYGSYKNQNLFQHRFSQASI